MFNRKKIEELELRIWALENPCKFEVGEKLMGGGVVIKKEPKYDWLQGYHWMITYFCDKKIICRREWTITCFKLKNKKTKKTK